MIRHLFIPLVLLCAGSSPGFATDYAPRYSTGGDLTLIQNTLEKGLIDLAKAATEPAEHYRKALEAQMEIAKMRADKAAVEAAYGAYRSFKAGTPPTGKSTDPELAPLEKTYLAEEKRVDSTLTERTKALWEKHLQDLNELLAKALKQGDLLGGESVSRLIAEDHETLAELAKVGETLEEQRKAWQGKWEIHYENNQSRTLRITMTTRHHIEIQATGGTWAPHAKYTSESYQLTSRYFLARHAEEPGMEERQESYKLTPKGLEIQSWGAGQSSEHPETTGIGKRVKE